MEKVFQYLSVLILVFATSFSALSEESSKESDRYKNPTEQELREHTFSTEYEYTELLLSGVLSFSGAIIATMETTTGRKPVLASVSASASLSVGVPVLIDGLIDTFYDNGIEFVPMEQKMKLSALIYRINYTFAKLGEYQTDRSDRFNNAGKNPIRDPLLEGVFDQLYIISSDACDRLSKYSITSSFLDSLSSELESKNIVSESDINSVAPTIRRSLEESGALSCYDLSRSETSRAIDAIIIGNALNELSEKNYAN